MEKKILYCGLDVDDQAFHAHLRSEEGDVFHFVCKPNVSSLVRKLQPIMEQGFVVKLCYEAGYLGYSLQRGLSRSGFECQVIAPSLIPDIAGDQVKTDRLDSEKLSLYFLKGLLTFVHIPEADDEIDRDYIRSRQYLVSQLRSVRMHILSMCRRLGFDFKQETKLKTHWIPSHRTWLEIKINSIANPRLKKNFSVLMVLQEQLESTLHDYDREIEEMAKEPKYAKKSQALCCYRGLDSISSMTLITELGDIRRFGHPKHLVSYVGLDIREYSSGGRENKFGITRLGNAHLRRVLVESSQFSPRIPRISRRLRLKRADTPREFIEVADRCMKRLHKKSTKMIFSGKHRNKAVTACARELTGFIWESLRLAS